MSPGSVENPYQTSPTEAAISELADRQTRRYRLIANCETIFGIVLLAAATGLLFLAAAFVVWAIRQGDVPLLGLCMASGIRVALALLVGIPGGLLLMAARTSQNAALNKQPDSIKTMRMVHMILIISLCSIPLLLGGAMVAFFVALALSNM